MIDNSNIESLLKKFKTKIRSTNLFNANFIGNATKEYRIKYEGVLFKIYGFKNTIIIETDIDTAVSFTVNIPDKICSLNQFAGKIAELSIYTGTYNPRCSLECAYFISDFIEQLALKKEEGIIVYRNGIQLAINTPDKILASISILHTLRQTIERNFPGKVPKNIDIMQIPDNLRPLVPYLEKWAISDDDARQIRIKASSKEELQLLIDVISPRIDQINQYLGSFGNRPLTQEAILIGLLGELCDEIS